MGCIYQFGIHLIGNLFVDKGLHISIWNTSYWQPFCGQGAEYINLEYILLVTFLWIRGWIYQFGIHLIGNLFVDKGLHISIRNTSYWQPFCGQGAAYINSEYILLATFLWTTGWIYQFGIHLIGNLFVDNGLHISIRNTSYWQPFCGQGAAYINSEYILLATFLWTRGCIYQFGIHLIGNPLVDKGLNISIWNTSYWQPFVDKGLHMSQFVVYDLLDNPVLKKSPKSI